MEPPKLGGEGASQFNHMARAAPILLTASLNPGSHNHPTTDSPAKRFLSWTEKKLFPVRPVPVIVGVTSRLSREKKGKIVWLPPFPLNEEQ